MNIVINQLVKNFCLTSFSIGFFKNYLSDWQIACIQAPGIQGLAVDSDWLSTQNAIGASEADFSNQRIKMLKSIPG